MLAIIPARSGSKGLPGKNIKLMNGNPLIYYTIKSALESQYITRVIVTTDSRDIADISIKYGAEVPFLRPKEYANDDSIIFDTYIYTITELLKNEGVKYTEFVALQPTSPLRESYDIDNSISLFYQKNADSVISMTQQEHPIEWNQYINSDGKFSSVLKANIENRQKYIPTYYFNGAIYVFKYKLVEQYCLCNDNSFSYVMPIERSIDIDTLEHFEYAEYLMKKNKQKNN